jgi:serine/threonine protein phosphatase 1
MFLGQSSAPPDTRLYAIGDVHGRDDLLGAMHERVAADLAAWPVAEHAIIHMGDYIDRGSFSAQAIGRLAHMQRERRNIVCLMGNHEELLENFMKSPATSAAVFLQNGGVETLASYGIVTRADVSADEALAIRDLFDKARPAEHGDFLASLSLQVSFGDYFFCHAGIRPGVPLDQQVRRDLIWIRGLFHSDEHDHGKVIIHAHSPVDTPEVRPNRINIDTGAYFSGRLTCLVLEGTDYRFL